MSGVKSYVFLYINSNKNYFFERFPFLKTFGLEKCYTGCLLAKSILMVVVLYVMTQSLSEYALAIAAVPFAIFAMKLFGVDSKKWAHYYRADWLLAYPDDKKRFKELLSAHLVIDFILEDNVCAAVLFQCMYFDIFFLVSVYLSVLFGYILIMSFQLVLIQARLTLKKLYSVLSYIGSSMVTVYVFYVLIKAMVGFVTLIVQKSDIVSTSLSYIVSYFNNIWTLITSYHVFVLVSMALMTSLNLWGIRCAMAAGGFRNGTQHLSARTHDFWFIKQYIKFINARVTAYPTLIKKELSLIVSLYEFHYKEYLNTFFIDRSAYMLLAILFNVSDNYSRELDYILIPIIAVLFYTDINSGMCSKLVANMSLIADYSLLSILKMSPTTVNDVLVAKIKLFRLVRMPSFIFYLVIVGICAVVFQIRVPVFVVLVLIIVLLWFVLPTVFLANNLIYTRQDYAALSKYVEESTIIAKRAKEFFAIEWYYKFLTAWLLLSLVSANFVEQLMIVEVAFYVGAFVVVVLLLLLHRMMVTIKRNIVQALEGGDYSVDFAKIFKKRGA